MIPLDTFISIPEFCKNEKWVRYLGFNTFFLHLPTEVIMNHPELVFPYQARAWPTDRYYLNGKDMGYDYLKQLPGFSDTHAYNRIMLFEYWEDMGDDGHTAFYHKGYMFCEELRIINYEYPEQELCDKYHSWRMKQDKLPRR